MKSFSVVVLLMLALCCACVNNPLDSKQEDQISKTKPLKALLTKSGIPPVQEDSLTMMSKLQKDVNHLMMNRITLKDSVYVLSIKRQDAIFLGISEEIYDRYLEYVISLNEGIH